MSHNSDTDMSGPSVTNQSQAGADGAANPGISRRVFMARSMLAAAVTAAAPSLLLQSNKAHADPIPGIDPVMLQTMSGVLAFVVPGGDEFTVHQNGGEPNPTPGGVEAGAAIPLIFGLNAAAPAPPPFSTLSEALTTILNMLAPYLAPEGPFDSPFANLTFAQKTYMFSEMDNPAGIFGADFVGLSGPLITFAGMMTYSEAPVLDPVSGQLLAPPLGWALSSYEGISDGRKDFQGYYRGVRRAKRC